MIYMKKSDSNQDPMNASLRNARHAPMTVTVIVIAELLVETKGDILEAV